MYIYIFIYIHTIYTNLQVNAIVRPFHPCSGDIQSQSQETFLAQLPLLTSKPAICVYIYIYIHTYIHIYIYIYIAKS